MQKEDSRLKTYEKANSKCAETKSECFLRTCYIIWTLNRFLKIYIDY